MELTEQFAPALERNRRFALQPRLGTALINIDMGGSGFPLPPRTPYPCWRFPRDLHRYLDEQIALLLDTWAAKRGLEDDAIPSLYPRFGIAEHSAFVGGEVEFTSDTSYVHPCIRDWDDLAGLELRDDNPWLRMIVDGLTYLAEEARGRYAVMQRGAMSPLDLAHALRGNDLFIDFYDAPAQVHKLLEFCTRASLHYMKAQLGALSPSDGGAYCGCYVWMPGHSFGHLSEDAAVLCSPRLYREFGPPYTRQVTESFDHVFMHAHTAAAHSLGDIVSIDRVDFVELANDPNTPRGIEVLKAHREAFAGKAIKLFVTPAEIRDQVDFLREMRTILFCSVRDAAEGRAAIDFVRRELPV